MRKIALILLILTTLFGCKGFISVNMLNIRKSELTSDFRNYERYFKNYRKQLSTTNYIYAITSGDLNNDGKSDIVYGTNGASLFYYVQLGLGNGEFSPAVAYSVGSNTRFSDIKVADLNSDGFLDFIGADSTNSRLIIAYNDGRGVFGANLAYSTTGVPQSLGIDDLDGDGTFDIVITESSANIVSIRLNNGNGSFKPPSNVSTGTLPVDVAIADLNGDTHPELVVANKSSNYISVYTNGGAGDFAALPVTYPLSSPQGVLLIDVNGDSKLDMLALDRMNLNVRLNLGSGTFGANTSISASSSDLRNFLATDIDGDGDQDVLAVDYNFGQLAQFKNNGNGTLSAPEIIYLEYDSLNLAKGDFNSDGRADYIFSVGGIRPYLEMIFSKGDGAGLERGEFETESFLLEKMATGDFNGDGFLDMAGTDPHNSEIVIYFNDGSGKMSFETTIAGGSPGKIYAKDLDGDLDIDLIWVDLFGTLNVLLNNGVGSFSSTSPIALAFYFEDFDLVDINQDGYLDVVAPNNGLGEIFTFLNLGNATFAPPTQFNTTHVNKIVRVADVNQDGRLDIVNFTGGGGPNGFIEIYLQEGNGTFGTVSQSYQESNSYIDVMLHDFTNDGFPDLVFLEEFNGKIKIRKNNGDGTFANAISYPTGYMSKALFRGDFNQDGKEDIGSIEYESKQFTIIYSQGNGKFSDAYYFGVNSAPTSVVVGDFNRDGALDIMTSDGSTNTASGRINYFYNQKPQ